MKVRSVLLRGRNAILIFLPILLVASYAVHEVSANSSGIVGQSKIGCGLPVEGGCHGSKSTNTIISLSTDSAQIFAGKTYVFRLSIANASELGAGCDISVDNGAKLAVAGAGSGLQYIGGYYNELTHAQGPRVFTGDSAVWHFKYTAPTKAGAAHIFVAGNAVNLNGTNDANDHWNLSVDTLSILASGVAPQELSSARIEIFPNPSTSGRCTVSTRGMSGAGDITVSNASGAIVSHSQIALGLREPLDLSALPNGTYFLSLRTKDGQQMVRRVVVAR